MLQRDPPLFRLDPPNPSLAIAVKAPRGPAGSLRSLVHPDYVRSLTRLFVLQKRIVAESYSTYSLSIGSMVDGMRLNSSPATPGVINQSIYKASMTPSWTPKYGGTARRTVS